MTIVLAVLAYVAIMAAVLLGFRAQARANGRRRPPPVSAWWIEISLPMSPDEERELYRAYRQTAALQPGGVIVSRRA